MVEKFIAGIYIDDGFISVVLINKNGEIVTRSNRIIPIKIPQEGYSEMSANDVWSVFNQCVQECLNNVWIRASDIVSIGISSNAKSVLLWDKITGKAVTPIHCEDDNRTVDICCKVNRRLKREDLYKKYGIIFTPAAPALKLKWMLENSRALIRVVDKSEFAFGNVASWFLYRLSGNTSHCMDYTTYANTMFLDINEIKIDKRILELLKIPRGVLPKLVEPNNLLCEVKTNDVFSAGTTISALLSDVAAFSLGSFKTEKGDIMIKLDRYSQSIINTGNKRIITKNFMPNSLGLSRKCTMVNLLLSNKCFCESLFSWIYDSLDMVVDEYDLDESAQDGCIVDGFFIIPSVEQCEGVCCPKTTKWGIFGINRNVRRKDFLRGIVHTIGLFTSYNISMMQKGFRHKIRSCVVSGRRSLNNFLVQCISDLTGLKISRMKNIEAEAIGAGILAGISSGFWKDFGEISNIGKISVTFVPQLKRTERIKQITEWANYKKLLSSLLES